MATKEYGFYVYGPVRGMARPRVTRNGTFTPRASREARDHVRASALAAMPEGAETPLFGSGHPVAVSVTTWRALPKRRPAGVESEPDTAKPDIDNVAKLVMDALKGVAYEDDAQVTTLYATKTDRLRGAEECMYVSVRQEAGGNE